MESKRCAKLILNTSLFYPLSGGSLGTVLAFDGTMGIADPMRINCTFTNLDLKQIIGIDMWEKYSEFNLVLVNATYLSAGGTPFGTGTSNYGVIIKCSGLDWSNQGYDVYKRSITNEATILTGVIINSSLQMPTFNTCTFRKPVSGLNDFTIRIYRALDGSQINAADRPAAFLYMFNIYGVDDSPK